MKFFLALDWDVELHFIWAGFVPIPPLIIIANSTARLELWYFTEFSPQYTFPQLCMLIAIPSPLTLVQFCWHLVGLCYTIHLYIPGCATL